MRHYTSDCAAGPTRADGHALTVLAADSHAIEAPAAPAHFMECLQQKRTLDNSHTSMRVKLRDISLPTFIERVFAHQPPTDSAKPWYFGRVTFDIEPAEQLRHLTEIFRSADALPASGLSNAQIELGLWCMLGGAHDEAFVSLIWDRSLPITLRNATIAALFELYDRLLAAAPFEPIDFHAPDRTPRRFESIDYMALALVVQASQPAATTAYDRARIRATLLAVLERLLDHAAPVAQYAALHGLGHLPTKRRVDIIDRYLATRPRIAHDQRAYALAARAGTLL